MINTRSAIRKELAHIKRYLLEKSKSYGDSALKPIKIFSKGEAQTLLRARIDDKLSRIANMPEAYGEDSILDLIGYLVLLRIEMNRCARTGEKHETNQL